MKKEKKMTQKCLGMLAMAFVLVGALAITGCDDGSGTVGNKGNPFVGTWQYGGLDGLGRYTETLIMTASNTFTYTQVRGSTSFSSYTGTYTYSGNSAILTLLSGSDSLGLNLVGTQRVFTVSGNTLTLNNNNTIIFIKQ